MLVPSAAAGAKGKRHVQYVMVNFRSNRLARSWSRASKNHTQVLGDWPDRPPPLAEPRVIRFD
jgi:hypothetical protein